MESWKKSRYWNFLMLIFDCLLTAYDIKDPEYHQWSNKSERLSVELHNNNLSQVLFVSTHTYTIYFILTQNLKVIKDKQLNKSKFLIHMAKEQLISRFWRPLLLKLGQSRYICTHWLAKHFLCTVWILPMTAIYKEKK